MPSTPGATANSAPHLCAASAPELGSLYALFPNLAAPTGQASHEADAWLPVPMPTAEAVGEKAAL